GLQVPGPKDEVIAVLGEAVNFAEPHVFDRRHRSDDVLPSEPAGDGVRRDEVEGPVLILDRYLGVLLLADDLQEHPEVVTRAEHGGFAQREYLAHQRWVEDDLDLLLQPFHGGLPGVGDDLVVDVARVVHDRVAQVRETPQPIDLALGQLRGTLEQHRKRQVLGVGFPPLDPAPQIMFDPVERLQEPRCPIHHPPTVSRYGVSVATPFLRCHKSLYATPRERRMIVNTPAKPGRNALVQSLRASTANASAVMRAIPTEGPIRCPACRITPEEPACTRRTSARGG